MDINEEGIRRYLVGRRGMFTVLLDPQLRVSRCVERMEILGNHGAVNILRRPFDKLYKV